MGKSEVKWVWLLKDNMRTPSTWKYSIFCLYEHKYPGRDVILWFCKMYREMCKEYTKIFLYCCLQLHVIYNYLKPSLVLKTSPTEWLKFKKTIKPARGENCTSSFWNICVTIQNRRNLKVLKEAIRRNKIILSIVFCYTVNTFMGSLILHTEIVME